MVRTHNFYKRHLLLKFFTLLLGLSCWCKVILWFGIVLLFILTIKADQLQSNENSQDDSEGVKHSDIEPLNLVNDGDNLYKEASNILSENAKFIKLYNRRKVAKKGQAKDAFQKWNLFIKKHWGSEDTYYHSNIVEDVSGDSEDFLKQGQWAMEVRGAIEKLEKAALEYHHADSLLILGNAFLYGEYGISRNLKKSFHYYQILADEHANGTARSMLGFFYGTGLGGVVERDLQKSLIYHSFASLSGELLSQLSLGYRYLTGIGVPKNCNRAIYYYESVANAVIDHYSSGPPGGMSLPAPKTRLYEDYGGVYGLKTEEGGNVITEDFLEYYKFMAERGEAAAQYFLGQLYYEGHTNVKKDYRQAFKYLKSAAKSDGTSSSKVAHSTSSSETKPKALAAGLLGHLYWRGEGVAQSTSLAYKWFLRGAEEGSANAFYGLGKMYWNGIEVKRDREKAVKFFIRAADGSHSGALSELGKIYFDRRDYQSSMKYFNLASRAGDIVAMYYIGRMHANGLGISKSCVMATAFYKNLVEKGDWMYPYVSKANSYLKKGDIGNSIIDYMKAAEMGFEIAQSNLAWIIDQEEYPLPTDIFYHAKLPSMETSSDHVTPQISSVDPFSVAYLLWSRSANQGNVESRIKVGDYHYYGRGGVPVDFNKAASYYLAASDSEFHPMAMWTMGWLYENGIGVNQDFYLSKRYYDRALTSNPNAFLPVNLSLIKLGFRYLWGWISGDPATHGTDFFEAVEQLFGVSSEHEHTNGEEPKADVTDRFDDEDDEDEIYKSGNAFVFPEGLVGEANKELVENVMMVILLGVIAWLIYVRHTRQQWEQRFNRVRPTANITPPRSRMQSGSSSVGGNSSSSQAHVSQLAERHTYRKVEDSTNEGVTSNEASSSSKRKVIVEDLAEEDGTKVDSPPPNICGKSDTSEPLKDETEVSNMEEVEKKPLLEDST